MCSSADAVQAVGLRKSGVDFLELIFRNFEKTSLEDAKEFRKVCDGIGLTIDAANMMFRDNLPVTGANVDYQALREYFERCLEISDIYGIKSAVFGSGSARKIRDGMTKEETTEQIIKFCTDIVAPVFANHKAICCIEPLNSGDCSIVNSCAEAFEIIKTVDKPQVRLLADLYHMDAEGEKIETLVRYKGYLKHIHIANAERDRQLPARDDGRDYKRFFDILREAGYGEGDVSLEGRVPEEGRFEIVKEAVFCLRSL